MTWPWSALEQRHLPVQPRPAKGLRVQWTHVAIDAVFAAEHLERLCQLLDDLALPAAALVRGGGVKLSAAGLADERFDVLRARRVHAALEPVKEQVLQLVRQPQQHPRDARAAGVGDGLH